MPLVAPVEPVPLAGLGRVHFTGIGGAGMSGIARIMIARGVTVSGSDAAPSDLLTALAGLGAEVHVGHAAANVDGDNRPKIGKRQGDRWYRDPRIQKSEQLGQEAFEHGIDRGHLTRREDTAWGEDVDSALRANNDTFHFTKCSLQASPFNRG